MPDRIIPCQRCDQYKKDLEKGGIWKVISCEPIKYKTDKCKIIYKAK